jgi:hypothetical protein
MDSSKMQNFHTIIQVKRYIHNYSISLLATRVGCVAACCCNSFVISVGYKF